MRHIIAETSPCLSEDGFLQEPQAAGSYDKTLKLKAEPDPDCDPTQQPCEMWYPGNYTVIIGRPARLRLKSLRNGDKPYIILSTFSFISGKGNGKRTCFGKKGLSIGLFLSKCVPAHCGFYSNYIKSF